VDRVAVGAAAQAAALLDDLSPDAVGAAWAGADQVVVLSEPRIDSTLASEIRTRYRDAASEYATRPST
jgi:hypothetical protein